MEKGIITFSFDDGRKDTYYVFKNILTPLRIPAVVYVPTGFIESGYDNCLEVGYNGLMSKTELDEIQANGLFEIGGHGFMHKNDFEDIEKGMRKLREWYPAIKEFGLASPHSEVNHTFVKKHYEKYLEIGAAYVRGGRNFEKHTKIKRAISLLARVTRSPDIFQYCYKNSVNWEKGYYLHAIPIHKLTTLEQVCAMVDYCVRNKCWGILEFHSIDQKDSLEYREEFCWLEDDFIELCHYVKALQDRQAVDVRTPGNVLL